MKSILLPFIGVALFIVAVGLLTNKLQGHTSKQISIGSAKVAVEIADTQELRQQGLSGRSSLGENEGMLFIFEQKNVFPSFWMKDMLFPLDFIWINDGKVAKIDKNISPPTVGTTDEGLTLYRPDKPIDYVLEVNAGFSDKNHIKVGASVEGLPK